MDMEIDMAVTTAASDAAEGTPSMARTLAQRQREAVGRCAAAARTVGRRLLFGMTTALELQGVPLPRDCDLDVSALHAVASGHTRRASNRSMVLRWHVWKHFDENDYRAVNRWVCVLGLFHVWVQLAVHVESLVALVTLADAIVMAEAKRMKRNADDVRSMLVGFVHGMPRFMGKRRCVAALRFVRANVMSPQESECRMTFLGHGLPCPLTGYVVPGLVFRSGREMTLDMAWPEFKVAVEYDGDQHRTDQAQWRRDKEKRDRLRAHGWIVITATAANLASDQARAELAFEVARALALRGAEFDFRVVARAFAEW